MVAILNVVTAVISSILLAVRVAVLKVVIATEPYELLTLNMGGN